MKIIFSNYDDKKNPDYGGGGAMAIHEVAKHLAKKYPVKVLTGRYKNSQNEKVDEVEYKRIGTSIFGPKIGQLIFLFILPVYALKENYDVWLESFTPPFSTSCLQLFTKKPVIGVVHSLSGEKMYETYKLPFHLLERWGLKTYRQIVVLSDYFKNKLEKTNQKAKIYVIPNGVSEELLASNLEKTTSHFLFLGRLEKNQKGLDLLLEILKKLNGKISQKVLIAGNGPDRIWLEEQVNQAGLNNFVEFLGHIEGIEKTRTLNGATALLVTSRYEALPLTILEGFSQKTPSVYFNIQELAWLPENISFKIEPWDTRQFATQVIYLDKNPAMSVERGEMAKTFSARFNWEETSAAYKQLIEHSTAYGKN